MANKGGGLPGGGLGILAIIALVLGGGFVLMKAKGNGNGGSAPPAAMFGAARKPGGCGCGK